MEEENEFNIACRTRSHLQIDDSVLNDNLDLPDVDMDLYQNPSSEPDYNNFLNTLFKDELGQETDDTEYIYNNDIYSHGWAFDLDEVLEPKGSNIDLLGPENARILDLQLRQNVQLLTQTFILTKNAVNLRFASDDAERHLQSYLKVFKDRTKPSNLLPALNLVKNYSTKEQLRPSVRFSWRHLPLPDSIKKTIRDNPNIFIYSDLLPTVSYSSLERPKKKDLFTMNEDKLLTYALHEFRGEASKYQLISSLLMTTKSKKQLINHVKNIKRSAATNPIKLYFEDGKLPEIDQQQQPPIIDLSPITEPEISEKNQEFDDIMDMDLDDLVAASSTISKPAYSNNVNNSETRFIRNLKLRKSMLDLMSHNFIFSENMGSLLIDEFLSSARQKLNERHYLHLLQLLADLDKGGDIAFIHQEIIRFITKIEAPIEFHEKVVLFLDLKQATKCGCAMSHLHWMRFFKFMQHIELYHDGVEVLEKKLVRLIDALQKNDSHKIKLAVANMVNKHPFLKREYDSLCLDGKPHQSLFVCEEDFDDITEPLSKFEGDTSAKNVDDLYKFEHFSSKVSKEELSYASQNCPCKCHTDGQPTQHCGRCNLKFMRGRMYLVNKIKPILAEWSYIEPMKVQWTFEEDREILEFCRCKAERSEETVFDLQTFEEMANSGTTKKTAQDFAKRFNELIDIYKDSIGTKHPLA